MLYKTLKHKELKDTFGVITEYEKGPEIAHCNTPTLMPYTATMEGLVELLEKDDINKTMIEQLKDYDMVIVSLMIIEKE